MGPRHHHYLFAHRELPSATFSFGADLVAAAREGRLALPGVWDRVGEALPEPDRLSPVGLTVAHHGLPGYEVALVTFPPPQRPAEAHFAAVAVPTVPPSGAAGNGLRYLTLDAARSPVDGQRYTVLAEWTADGSHLNHGVGPAPYPGEFLLAVARTLAGRRPD
jgi:hypothetical protein